VFRAIDAIGALCDDLKIVSLRVRLEGEAIGLRVSILASGSSGNITLLETQSTRLLVDAGLGKRETLAWLAAIEHDVEHLASGEFAQSVAGLIIGEHGYLDSEFIAAKLKTVGACVEHEYLCIAHLREQ